MTLHPVVLALLVTGAGISAQMARPKADVTPLIATDGVHAGGDVRLALRVALPQGVHVQSDKPRDSSLIPTVLTLDRPDGIALADVVYPIATDLAQAGQQQPLAVFEQAFVVGVRLAVDRAVPVGELVVPAKLRYQACDATACYPPATAAIRWTLRIVPASVATPALDPDTFARIRFAPTPR